ncbi:MAG: enoyl-CoA hydratase-related protein [Steroidobacteraceae bacterium]
MPLNQYNVLIRVLRRLNKPVVVSVQGAIAGAAVGLATACDLLIADSAYFFVPHMLHGGACDGMTTYFLPRIIGVRKTMELALLGERISAAEAQRLGLVNFVVPAAEFEAETAKLATRLASGPTRAYGLIRNEVEAESYAASANTSDWSEGIRAFLEKRKPKFSGA